MAGEGRRGAVLRAARDLMDDGGLAAVTVRAVAARAGIGASTLRHYFPSQQDLHAALVQDGVRARLDDHRIDRAEVPAGDRLAECLSQFLPPDETARGALDAWFAAYATALGPAPAPLGLEVLREAVAAARQDVERWCRTLDAEGTLATPVDVAVDASLAAVDGVCLMLLQPGTGSDVSRAHAVLRVLVVPLTR